MNKKRLLKLADLLEADAKNKKGIVFDLGRVGESSDWLAENYRPAVNCGTTACAMGLAAISGAFKRHGGLSYKLRGTEIETTINGRRQGYVIAAQRIFDISVHAAYFLFSPSHYDHRMYGAIGERFVAKRIRDFVAGKVQPSKD